MPSLTEFVNDELHVLSADEKRALDDKLSQFNRETSIQMAIAILPTPNDEALEEFTMEVADHARIGQSSTDNGLILFVFPRQRQARLGAHYAQALDETVDAVINLSHSEYSATKEPGRFARLVRTFAIGSAKVAKNAWPLLREVSLVHQVVVSFFAAFLLIGLGDGVRQLIGLTRNVAISVRNLRSGQTLETGTTRVDLNAISDSMLTLLPLLGAIIAAAGAVLFAGGGAFGGGGATVHF